jgi:hypothetical protein
MNFLEVQNFLHFVEKPIIRTNLSAFYFIMGKRARKASKKSKKGKMRAKKRTKKRTKKAPAKKVPRKSQVQTLSTTSNIISIKQKQGEGVVPYQNFFLIQSVCALALSSSTIAVQSSVQILRA